MGVTGLTSYLSKCGARYKRKIYVSHQPVVIDGNNLMFHLYSSYDVKKYNHHLFGGDCILFAQAVREFFQKLKCCKVHPIVVFDGAYEPGKLKTKMKRFGQSLKENVRQSTPGKTYTTALMKDVFVEILVEQDIDHYQTEFEADNTVAFIAQQLSCPVLSSDSDFFIYAKVTTIPFGTINFKKRQQKSSKKAKEDGGENSLNLSTHALEGKCIILQEMCKEEFHLSDYRLLPLTAVVIGNDQISNGVFTHFMSKKKADTSRGKHDRIDYLIKWFSKQRSYEAGLETLLGTIRARDRENMRELIHRIVTGYMGGAGEDDLWKIVNSSQNLRKFLEENGRGKEVIGEVLHKEDETNVGDTSVSSANRDREQAGKLEGMLNESLQHLKIREDKDDNVEAADSEDHNDEDEGGDESDDDSDSESNCDNSLTKPKVPSWFLDSLYKCQFPTPICKILYNQTVYLTPQVEVTTMPSSHAISVPIIQVLSGLLYGTGTVTLVSRDKYNPVKLEVPTLTSVGKDLALPCVTESDEDFRQTIAHDKRLKILLQTLLVKPEEEEFIHEWPPYIKLWIAACIYYLRKLKKTKDLYIGVSVSVAVILSCLKAYSFSASTLSQPQKEETTEKVSSLLKQQVVTNSLRKLFQWVSEIPNCEAKKFWRTYDMTRVFFFSQFQSVMLHAQTLNILLGEPLRSPKFYTLNCNIVYNICTSVIDSCGGDVLHFLDKKFEKSSPLKYVLKKFIVCALQGQTVSPPIKDACVKRERRKKGGLNESNDEKLNRFMLLDITD